VARTFGQDVFKRHNRNSKPRMYPALSSHLLFRPFRHGLALGALASGCLASCSVNHAPVLSTMSASVENDRKWVQNVPFERTLSLSAAAPFTDVANVWRYDPKAGYSTAIGLTGHTNSYVSRTEVLNEKGYDPEELNDLQVALLELQQHAARMVTCRFNRELIPDMYRYASLESGGGANNLKAGRNQTGTTRDQAHEQAYRDAQDSYEKAYRAVAGLVNKPGIVVMRWQSESHAEVSGRIVGLAALGGSKGRRFGGLVVAAGLRQSVLHVGPDVRNVTEWLPAGQAERMKVTTHALQTKHAIWVKDLTMEAVFGAQLKLKAKDASLERALQAAQVELAFAQASISNLASIGYFSEPERSVEAVDWSQPGHIARLEQDDWLTLLVVDTELKNLIRVSGG